MRSKLFCLAVLITAALVSVSCSSDDKKNPPLLSYFQINNANKYALKWAAAYNLNPAANEGYDIALSVGRPFNDGRPQYIGNQTDVFTFRVPMEYMGRTIQLVPTGSGNPDGWKWRAEIKCNDEYYATGEDYAPEEATIRGGTLKVTRSGMQNQFTIVFLINLPNGNVVSGTHEGKLVQSDNVYFLH